MRGHEKGRERKGRRLRRANALRVPGPANGFCKGQDRGVYTRSEGAGEEMTININSIRFEGSLADGPGVRTVLFVQGCDIRCEGCQNTSAWDADGGRKMSTAELAGLLAERCENRKLTISGGEPLMQAEAVADLIGRLKGFDIALYTGHEREDVPGEILSGIRYLKTGRFRREMRTAVMPYVGSSNQVFEEVTGVEEQ